MNTCGSVQAFDPADRPTCEEALADPYFAGLAQAQREPAAQPVSKLAFEFERRKLHTEEVRLPHLIAWASGPPIGGDRRSWSEAAIHSERTNVQNLHWTCQL